MSEFFTGIISEICLFSYTYWLRSYLLNIFFCHFSPPPDLSCLINALHGIRYDFAKNPSHFAEVLVFSCTSWHKLRAFWVLGPGLWEMACWSWVLGLEIFPSTWSRA